MRPAWIDNGEDIPDPLGFGERAVQWLRKLQHPKSRLPGKQFQLDPWMARVVKKIYGPRESDGRRIVQTVFLMLPRGSRKTTLAAALILLHTLGPEKVAFGQVISAASDREQAGIAYSESASILRENRAAAKACKILDSRKRLTFKKTGTTYEAVAAESAGQHGKTPSFVLCDELHVFSGQRGRDLWDALRTGLAKTDDGLLIVATTAGAGTTNLAHDIYQDARKIASGEAVDPSFLPVLFEAPKDGDWRDEALWHDVNPGLALGYPSLRRLRTAALEAERRPHELAAFKQYHLNVWREHSATPFVNMDVWDAGNLPIDLDALEGQPCWLGLDVGIRQDLSAVVAAFRDPDVEEGYRLKGFYFVPHDRLAERATQDGVPYPAWAEAGLIEATAGNVIDQRRIEKVIRELCERFEVHGIAADPAYAQGVTGPLKEDGYPVFDFRQGWVTMGPAIREFERAILAKRIRHGGDPVLRWNIGNIAYEIDGKGNPSFNKGKSTDRIDGAVAATMAIQSAAIGNDVRGYYNHPEMKD
jgi:phage terminase large subunit-like protein